MDVGATIAKWCCLYVCMQECSRFRYEQLVIPYIKGRRTAGWLWQRNLYVTLVWKRTVKEVFLEIVSHHHLRRLLPFLVVFVSLVLQLLLLLLLLSRVACFPNLEKLCQTKKKEHFPTNHQKRWMNAKWTSDGMCLSVDGVCMGNMCPSTGYMNFKRATSEKGL